MANVSFALVLNVHQPAWNLEDLLQHREWEAKEILWAIDRIPRSLWNSDSTPLCCFLISHKGFTLSSLLAGLTGLHEDCDRNVMKLSVLYLTITPK
jgi:hypothetical protein